MRTLEGPVNARTSRQRAWRIDLVALPLAAALALSHAPSVSAQTPVPAEQTAAAHRDRSWRAPRLSWGDPDLQGTFTSRDMVGIPMVRPMQFGNRATLTPEEFAERAGGGQGIALVLGAAQAHENRIELSSHDAAEAGTRLFGYTSYIIDPPNGQMPALTPAGRRRQVGFSQGQANGPFLTTEDFSHYDRCVTRGVTGSILPSLYGDAIRVVQSPTEVAISYEMLHDTRIITLDGRPSADPAIHQYMGSSVGRFEGDTLVVETTNLTDKLGVANVAHSESAKLIERFTRIDPEMIDYVVTVEDPETFERPWTFRVTLTTQPDYEVLEYSCHEGNFFIANALRAEQQYQRQAAEAIARGEPVPERKLVRGTGLEIYDAPPVEEAVNINRTR